MVSFQGPGEWEGHLSPDMPGVLHKYKFLEKREEYMTRGKPSDFFYRVPVFSPGILTVYTVGFLLFLLGIVVILSVFGYPVSLNGVYGLLVIMFFLQFLSAGSTPLGYVPRSVPVLLIGFAGTGLGILSCCIPGFLEWGICLLIAVLSITAGVVNMYSGCVRIRWTRLLRFNCLLCGMLSAMFGVNMLVPFVSPFYVGMILLLFGGSLCTFGFLLNRQDTTDENTVPAE